MAAAASAAAAGSAAAAETDESYLSPRPGQRKCKLVAVGAGADDEVVVSFHNSIVGEDLGALKIGKGTRLKDVNSRLLRALGARSHFHVIVVSKTGVAYSGSEDQPFETASSGDAYAVYLPSAPTDVTFLAHAQRQRRASSPLGRAAGAAA